MIVSWEGAAAIWPLSNYIHYPHSDPGHPAHVSGAAGAPPPASLQPPDVRVGGEARAQPDSFRVFRVDKLSSYLYKFLYCS